MSAEGRVVEMDKRSISGTNGNGGQPENRSVVDVVVILDRSGSMAAIRSEMQAALDAFIDEQRKEQAGGNGSVLLTMVLFDDDYEVAYEALPPERCPRTTLEPRGTTALLDALGRSITAARGRSLEADRRPDKVVVCVITDGLENASTEWSLDQVQKLIKEARDQWGWELVYLGANQDAIHTAAKLGVAQHAAMTYAPSAAAVGAVGRNLNQAVNSFRTSRSWAGFTDEDRRKARARGKPN
jgi:hypothetical protein